MLKSFVTDGALLYQGKRRKAKGERQEFKTKTKDKRQKRKNKSIRRYHKRKRGRITFVTGFLNLWSEL